MDGCPIDTLLDLSESPKPTPVSKPTSAKKRLAPEDVALDVDKIISTFSQGSADNERENPASGQIGDNGKQPIELQRGECVGEMPISHGNWIPEDIKLLEEEEFDFDVPLLSTSSSDDAPIPAPDKEGDDEDDDEEIFFGPVGHMEKCVAKHVEEEEMIAEVAKPLGPLSAEEMAHLFVEAQKVAIYIETKNKPTDSSSEDEVFVKAGNSAPLVLTEEPAAVLPTPELSLDIQKTVPDVQMMDMESKETSRVTASSGSTKKQQTKPTARGRLLKPPTGGSAAAAIRKSPRNTLKPTAKSNNVGMSPNKRRRTDTYELEIKNASFNSDSSDASAGNNGNPRKRSLPQPRQRSLSGASGLPQRGSRLAAPGGQTRRSMFNASSTSTSNKLCPSSSLRGQEKSPKETGQPKSMLKAKQASHGITKVSPRDANKADTQQKTQLRAPSSRLSVASANVGADSKSQGQRPRSGLSRPSQIASGSRPSGLPSKSGLAQPAIKPTLKGPVTKLELLKPGAIQRKTNQGKLASKPAAAGPMKALAPMKPLQPSNGQTTEAPTQSSRQSPLAAKQAVTDNQRVTRLSSGSAIQVTPKKQDKNVQPKRILPADLEPHTPRRGSDSSLSTASGTPASATRSAKRRSFLPTPSKSTSSAGTARSSLTSVSSIDSVTASPALRRGRSPSIGVLVDINGINENSPSCMKSRSSRVQHTPLNGEKENVPKRSLWSPITRQKPISREDAVIACTKRTTLKYN